MSNLNDIYKMATDKQNQKQFNDEMVRKTWYYQKLFGFELSFPKDNAQGLGFEPWHWRYVGKTGEYKKIFEDTRKNDLRFKDEY